jgi:hypothetical protein
MEQKPESLIYSAESSLWDAASSLTKSVEMRCEYLECWSERIWPMHTEIGVALGFPRREPFLVIIP